MMKILFLLFVLLCNYSYSQDSLDCTVFVNEEGEVIAIDQERISYRLRGGGGLVLLSFYTGEYQKGKRNEYILNKDENLYAEIEERKNSKEDYIKLCIEYKEGNPLNFAPIVFDKSQNFLTHQYFSDESGCISLNLRKDADSIIYTTIHVLKFGESFKQVLKLEKGRDYDLRMKIPEKYSFRNLTNRKYLRIEYEEDIRLYDSGTKEWKYFKKDETRENCHEAIFEE